MTDRNKVHELREALLGMANDFELANGAVVSSVPATAPDILREADATIVALLRELDAKDARIAELEKPNWFYDAENWECTYSDSDLDDLMDAIGAGEVVELGRLHQLPKRFAIILDGDLQIFDTAEEAEAAKAAGLAADAWAEKVRRG